MKKLNIILLLALVLLMLLPKYPTEEKKYTPCFKEPTKELLQPKNFKPAIHWKEITVEATAYCNCKHCTNSGKGITASGAKTSKGVIAAPDYIPFGTIIKLDGLGEFVVQDRGRGIKVKDGVIFIDVWFPSHQEAVDFGRKKNLKGWIKVEQ